MDVVWARRTNHEHGESDGGAHHRSSVVRHRLRFQGGGVIAEIRIAGMAESAARIVHQQPKRGRDHYRRMPCRCYGSENH